MKKIKGFCILVLTTVCCMALLTACANDDFNELAPSTVDFSEWPLTGDMDTLTYRAGDDFFMYCNGNYWKTTDLGGAWAKTVFGEADSEMDKLINQTDQPHKTQLEVLAKAVKNKPMTEDEMDENMAPLMKLIDEASTNEDCIRLIARFYKMGYSDMLNVGVEVADGVFVPMLMSTFYYPADDESVAGTAFVKPQPTRRQLFEHPELTEKYHPLATTRSDGNDVVTLLATELGLNQQDLLVDDESLADFAAYLTVPVETMKDDLAYLVRVMDQPFMDPSLATDSHELFGDFSPGSSFEDWKNDIIKTCFYTTAYHFANKWVTPQMVEDMEGKCEELRSVFRRRIADLDWMSGTTKEKAIHKLDMMTMNVGYPKNWVKEALVDFSQCQTMVEAVRLARKAELDLLFSYMGKDIKSNGFNAIISINRYDLTEVNAFSVPGVNGIFIMPAFLMPPMYDLDAHDAIKYATLYVIGHEITHCFDDMGALFDELGNYRNWWTVQDKMDFEERYQGLVDCYNRLEMLPWDPDYAGKYCPGEQTLGENIADLGGFEMARQAYIEKCQRDGYYGEELDKQERKFYQAYAHIWCGKYTSAYVDYWMFNVKDEHAIERERINGVVMNTDRWYDLYNVQWGDNLYLRPEKRTHIW